MEIICVPAIVSVTYALIEIYKKIIDKSSKKDMLLKLIPLFAMIIGGILGVVVFYVAPQIIIANNVWFALIVGMASGLSATGTNQVFKQLNKLGIEVKEEETNKPAEIDTEKWKFQQVTEEQQNELLKNAIQYNKEEKKDE